MQLNQIFLGSMKIKNFTINYKMYHGLLLHRSITVEQGFSMGLILTPKDRKLARGGIKKMYIFTMFFVPPELKSTNKLIS